MLVKKYLQEIPLCDAEFLKKPKNQSYRKFEYTFVKIDISVACGEVLVADFYSEEKQLLRRVFCDGKNWITLENDSWHRRNFADGYYSSVDYVETEESRKLSKDFFERHEYKESFRTETGDFLRSFIARKESAKRQEYANNKYDRMMAQIESIPAIPKKVQVYCNEVVFSKKYIVLKTKEKATEKRGRYKCLYCGKSFSSTTRMKHKSSMTCPRCKAEATVIAEHYISSIKDKAKLLILHKVNGSVQKQWINVDRTYNSISLSEKYMFDPYHYEIETEKKIYSYRYVSSWWTAGFTDTKWRCSDEVHVYADNMKEVFENGWFLNLNMERLRYAGKVDFIQLIGNAAHNETTWQIYKIGLYNLASNSVNQLHGSTFEEVLGVSKNYLPSLKKYNISTLELDVLKKSNTFLDDELLGKLFRLTRTNGSYNLTERLDQTLKHMTFVKMINYFAKQSEINKKRSFAEWLMLYNDYISMLGQINEKLPKSKKIDMKTLNVRFPKDIKTAHDNVSSQLRIQNNTKKEKALKKIFNSIKNAYSFTNNGMTIVIPQSIADFIEEGSKLNHCVGSGDSYLDGHIEGKWRVLFVRKADKPESPYYTLTIHTKDYNVKYCLGKGNKEATSEVSAFLKKYKEHLKKTTTRKDKQAIDNQIVAQVA